jgi:arylsulfatase A-like enzyme
MALLAVFVTPTGCGEERATPRPNLVLIVIDTLRADHLGAYGYERPTSPHLDAFAARGTLFTNAMAPSSWTRPSVASLFTSRFPSEHGAVSMERTLSGEIPTLAERLREAGYRTLGVCGNFVHITEDAGLTRGFDVWRSLSVKLRADTGDVMWTQEVEGGRIPLRAPRAAEINREVLARVPGAGAQPLFLYVHYMDPHAGYAPPARLRADFATNPALHEAGPAATSDYVVALAAGRASADAAERQRLVDLYDAEIAAVDAALGHLVESLERRGFAGNTVFAVVSDHGEEFQEHGSWFHGLTLHGESLRVPLLLWDTFGAIPAGVRREEPVDLLDVPTTLLDLAGVDPAPGMRGRALLEADAPTTPRDLLSELHPDPPFEAHVRPRTHEVAMVRWPWKIIVVREQAPLLYRLDRDPRELSPLSPQTLAAPPDLLEQALAQLRSRASRESSSTSSQLSAETLDALRALGYVE